MAELFLIIDFGLTEVSQPERRRDTCISLSQQWSSLHFLWKLIGCQAASLCVTSLLWRSPYDVTAWLCGGP